MKRTKITRRVRRPPWPKPVLRLLSAIAAYIESATPKPPEPQRDIDHRVQGRILPSVRTLSMHDLSPRVRRFKV